MKAKRNLLAASLAAVTLLSTVAVSAATWTTDTVSGTSFKSTLKQYGEGTRYLHARGISGTGKIDMYTVDPWSPDDLAATVNTKVAVNTQDVWYSKAKAPNGSGQSYYYVWSGSNSSASSNMRVSDY
ncbi:hypothetical protein [Planococcus sp. NCCP-2050]|uniref:hypothetical protein n=1 Tax=Planococcus sp. NCCP-2050 TaxID=2944679 RepID=UPI0020402704|nr:hypothetical protein [Planococcus sp. NCCP-2050]GKW46950.1 hypothetical protein NCCP2050_26420 [Planococcus sp. NCCP-2050]